MNGECDLSYAFKTEKVKSRWRGGLQFLLGALPCSGSVFVAILDNVFVIALGKVQNSTAEVILKA